MASNVPATSPPLNSATSLFNPIWISWFQFTVATLSAVNVFTKNQSVATVALTDAATVAMNASLSNNFELLATAGVGATRKLANPTNATAGMVINLWFYQDASGSRALTFDTQYKFAGGTVPTASTAANAVDFYSMSYSATKKIWVVVQTKGLG